MASQASVGAGAGLTSVATDKVNLTALHARTPEAMFIDWEDSDQVVENIKRMMDCDWTRFRYGSTSG